MTENVLVTGGMGTLGRHVVSRLAAAGRPVRVLSRTRGPYLGDLNTGAGLPAALDGVRTILHLASDPRGAVSDVEGTRRAHDLRGVPHRGREARRPHRRGAGDAPGTR